MAEREYTVEKELQSGKHKIGSTIKLDDASPEAKALVKSGAIKLKKEDTTKPNTNKEQ